MRKINTVCRAIQTAKRKNGEVAMKISIKSENGTAVAMLSGSIDIHTVRSAMSEIDNYVSTVQPHKLIVDLTNAIFADSSVVGLIIGRYKLMKEHEGKLEVRNPNTSLRQAFRISGIERIVKIV